MNYTVRPAAVTPQLGADWQDSIWAQAETLEIQHFRPEGSDHRPRTFARLLHTADGIQGIFHVHDRYVRCRRIWTLGFFIPFALFEHYLGPLGAPASQVWRSNFFKCADESSHPHWASWSPVDKLDFHRPQCFGMIRFA